jgi:hypothetical protein
MRFMICRDTKSLTDIRKRELARLVFGTLSKEAWLLAKSGQRVRPPTSMSDPHAALWQAMRISSPEGENYIQLAVRKGLVDLQVFSHYALTAHEV